MHIPRLKKGKTLSNIVSPVNFRDYNTCMTHKLLSSVARSKDFSFKDLKVVENNKKTDFPYIGYFSCRKEKGEAPVNKQKIDSGSLKRLKKVLENNKNKKIENKPGVNYEVGMAIHSIFRKDLLPNIQAKRTPKRVTRNLSTASICADISKNSRPTTNKISHLGKKEDEKEEEMPREGRSATNSSIKLESKKNSIKLKRHVKDPYHISNLMKSPSFTPFSSLLDCNTDSILSGFKYFQSLGNSNKGISLNKKVFEQQRLIIKSDHGK